MKKIITILTLIYLFLALSFCGCASHKNSSNLKRAPKEIDRTDCFVLITDIIADVCMGGIIYE